MRSATGPGAGSILWRRRQVLCVVALAVMIAAACGSDSPTSPTQTRIIGLSGNLAFGSVHVGSTATATLTISNSGTAALTVSGITYPPGFSGNWPSGSIAPGRSQSVTVTFAPTADAAYAGTVTVACDATSGTRTIHVSGTASLAPTRVLVLSGDLTFGNVPVGSTATATLTLANSGTAVMTVTAISYPAGFSGNWADGPIAAGGSQPVTVTFAPTAAGTHTGKITVTSDATSGASTIDVSGTAVPTPTRVIALSGTLAFGSVPVGSTSTAALTIINTGNAALTVTRVTYPDGFSGNWAAGSIAAGGSQTVTVTFAPTAPGAYNGSVTVTSNATSGAGAIAVSGTGGPSRIITITPSPIAFGTVQVGWTAQMHVEIRNTGTSTLTIRSTTPSSGMSNVLILCCGERTGVLAPGDHIGLTVRFIPLAPQPYSGALTCDSDATSGPQSVAISGFGTPGNPIALPEPYDVKGGRTYTTPLGSFTCLYCIEMDPGSINNPWGYYGSEDSIGSIRTLAWQWGNQTSDYSACNPGADSPPRVHRRSDGSIVGYLTLNRLINNRITDPNIVTWLTTNVCKR